MAATTTVVMFLDLTSVHVAKDSSSVMTLSHVLVCVVRIPLNAFLF